VSEQVERLALSLDEAALSLGISRDSLERHVLPELRVVRVGRRMLVSRRELDRYIDRHAALPLAEELERLGR
jgi:excisionase family DNA binding protein